MKMPLGFFTVRHHREEEAQSPHMTTAQVTIGASEDRPEMKFDAKAVCSIEDQFIRQFGRKLVAKRILSAMQAAGFTKEERRSVFWAICPEFAS